MYTYSEITGTVATPTFSPLPGTYTTAQDVAISCTTSGATIHYTTNGIDPTESDATYTNAVHIASTTTLKARAYKSGWDPSGIASGIYTIEFITVTSPNGGENWHVGSSHDITWTSVGTSGTVHIEYSTNGGSGWNDVTTSTPDDGSYSWTIPNAPSSNCLVRITDTDGSPTDQSDAVFTISIPPTVTSFSPTRNALNVAQGIHITATFSQDMNLATFTNSTIRINGSLSGLHSCLFSYDAGTRMETMTPNAQFRVGEVVNVVLTRGIMSTACDSLVSALMWSFTIQAGVGSGHFTQSSTTGVGDMPQSVTAGDFDVDGDIDLAVADRGSNTVSILMNNGSGTFTQSSMPGVGSNPFSVTVGDFNGDGSLDLAVTNDYDCNVSILISNGSGTFTQSSTTGVGSFPHSVIAGDFEKDGDIDLAVANYNSNTVSILMNNGSGTFMYSSAVAVGNSPQSVTAGDFDGDGYLDLAVANFNSNTISILMNNGSGTFTQSSTPGVGSYPISVTAGDFSGDGYLDLAVANKGSNTVSILMNNGSGTFTQSSTVGVGEAEPFSITAGDFNGDGDLDLAVSNFNSNTLSILMNNGSGTFTQSYTVSVGSAPYSVTAGDFNGDGDIDLAVANYGDDTISILMNVNPIITVTSPNGGVNWSVGSIHNITWTSAGTSGSVKIEYSTNSGSSWTTVIASTTDNGGYSWAVPNTPSTTCLVRVSDTNGSPSDQSDAVFRIFVPPAVTSFSPTRNALNVAQGIHITVTFSQDMNSATFTNSTVRINGSLSGLHSCSFSYNAGTRTEMMTPNAQFKVGEVVNVVMTRGIMSVIGDSLASALMWSFTIQAGVGSGHFTQSSTPGVGSWPYSVTAGDFDGDGDIDLAVVNYNSNTISILMNNGSGTFTQSSTLGVGSYPHSVNAGDFNGDGSIDLAVANGGSNTVSILLNNGSGTFTQSSTPGVGSWPYSVTAGDFDGDGDIDLAVVNYNSNNISILMNNGSGTFTQSSMVAVGNASVSVTAGNFNGDGYPDLAVANMYDNTVSILLNDGSGSFTQSFMVGVGSWPLEVTTGNFNGDGYLDLAVVNFYDNTIYILLNNGSGSFTQSSAVGVGSGSWEVTIGDFNGDGYLDLAVVNAASNTVSILFNNGSGTFTQSSTVAVGSSPRSVIAGDFNGDGDIDLAVANSDNNTVSILMNQLPNVKLNLKVWLEGSYQAGGTMTTTLRTSESIPKTSPYSDARTVANVPDGVTDWVSVELRSSESGPAVAQRSFFLKSNGAIVDTNGTATDLLIPDVAAGDYFIVVRHRNHLAIMSALAQALNAGSPSLYDFTTGSGQYYGSNGAKQVESGVWGMWAGDVNQDKYVTTMDYTVWYNSARQGEFGYKTTDINMDGVVTTMDYTKWYNNARLGASSSVP